jgi:hypothetical protein
MQESIIDRESPEPHGLNRLTIAVNRKLFLNSAFAPRIGGWSILAAERFAPSVPHPKFAAAWGKVRRNFGFESTRAFPSR